MKRFRKIMALTFMSVALCGNTLTAFATEPSAETTETPAETETPGLEALEEQKPETPSSDQLASDEEKERAKASLERHYSDLKILYELTEEQTKRMDEIYKNAITNMELEITTSELKRYESNVEGYLKDIAEQKLGTPPATSEEPKSEPQSSSNDNSNNSSSSSSIQYASDSEKDHVRSKLNRYYSDLKILYKLTEDQIKRMDRIYNSAMTYMKNAGLTMSELNSYESSVEGYLKGIADEKPETYSSTEKFLMLSNEVPILSAQYGEQTFVVLSLINLGKTDIKDVVVTPTVSNDKTKWPFDINQAYDARTIQLIQASDNEADALNKRMDIGWYFNVRSDVLTGCYPLPFHVTYYQDGALAETDITTYINVKGSDPKKTLIKDPDEDEDEKKQTNPRIIVTGYRTDPEVVYAGSTFNLTVSVKNTSREIAVENVLFNMEATVEGKDADATYSAFLPTSGSSSVYTERIAPGQTYDMSIEMEAKSDLSQKPYVLTVNMKYDTEDQINLSDSAHVSVPIKQEAKIDTGAAEIMPESIAVGEQSNVMFSVFNTGKTTLYNVKVTYESETVESGITYLGNITPGQTQNVDSMLTGIAPDTGEGIVKAVITYEDEAGNETRFEKDLNLFVYEMSFDDGMMDDFPQEPVEPEEENKKLPLPAIIGIVVAVIVVIVIIIVIISKKRKAKKHKEDMDLLDGDDV